LRIEDRGVFRASLTTHPEALGTLCDYLAKYAHVKHKMVTLLDAETAESVVELFVPYKPQG
jgi:hypothetical protein